MHKDRKRYSPINNCKNVDYPETDPENQKNYGSASGDKVCKVVLTHNIVAHLDQSFFSTQMLT